MILYRNARCRFIGFKLVNEHAERDGKVKYKCEHRMLNVFVWDYRIHLIILFTNPNRKIYLNFCIEVLSNMYKILKIIKIFKYNICKFRRTTTVVLLKFS